MIVTGPEEAYSGTAEFWCDSELMAVTVIQDGGLQLRIDARNDGAPWVIDTTSLARGPDVAARRLASYRSGRTTRTEGAACSRATASGEATARGPLLHRVTVPCSTNLAGVSSKLSTVSRPRPCRPL